VAKAHDDFAALFAGLKFHPVDEDLSPGAPVNPPAFLRVDFFRSL
jgi:hypothetical protein